jgi:hypothetical protein
MAALHHGHSQQMAFAAQRRLNMARTLGAAGGASGGMMSPMGQPAGGQPQGDFRQHVAAISGVPGVSPPEVHMAIDGLTQARQLTPLQGAALKAHQGPLNGPAGAQTVQKIAGAVRMRRQSAMAGQPRPGTMAPPPQPPGMPPQGPGTGGGMPGGMPGGMGQ